MSRPPDPPPVRPDYLRMMAAYNQWMNGKVLDACARLPAAALQEDRGAFFRSVIGTLNHLLYGDLAWLGRFKDGAPRATKPDEILFAALGPLREARERLDAEIVAWAGTVTESWLAAPFRYRSLVDGSERTRPGWLLAVHMFNHQTHHRGQLATVLTQLGQDVGVTDLPFMPGLPLTEAAPEP